MKFTPWEIEQLRQSPEALRIVADCRDVQQNRADDTGAGTTGDGLRAKELREEADRIEASY